MGWLNFDGLSHYFPTLQAAIYAALLTAAIGMGGYKIVEAWCDGRRFLAGFYGVITAGALLVAGQTEGLTFAAGITHGGGDRGRVNTTASTADVRSETLAALKADRDRERASIETNLSEIAMIEAIYAGFAGKEAQIADMRSQNMITAAKALEKELIEERSRAMPAPELAGKKSILAAAIAREAALNQEIGALQIEVDGARANAKTAVAQQNFLLAYAHNWAKNEDGSANPDRATALLALYGWAIWQIMEVFFCALSGGLAYEARQKRQLVERERDNGGSGVIGVSPEPPVSAVTVDSTPPPPPGPKKPKPEPEQSQTELFLVDLEEEETEELLEFSRNTYQGLEPRLMNLTLAQIRKGLGMVDAEKVLRRVNTKFDLNLGSRNIDHMHREKRNFHIRRALKDFPAHMALGKILMSPVIVTEMAA